VFTTQLTSYPLVSQRVYVDEHSFLHGSATPTLSQAAIDEMSVIDELIVARFVSSAARVPRLLTCPAQLSPIVLSAALMFALPLRR
jgi:hypothetical protein